MGNRKGNTMKMRIAVGVFLGVLVVSPLMATFDAAPAIAEDSAAAPAIPKELLGSWHSKSVHGDGLFLVLWGFQVDLLADGTFLAHVAFTDGEKKTFKGDFRMKPGDLVNMSVVGVKTPEDVHYTFETSDVLKLRAASVDVRFELERGKAKDKSGLHLF